MNHTGHVAERSDGPAARVLRVADQLFYRRGYAATGVSELIAEAGVARASFYQHFPSKLDLIVAYLRHRHEMWFDGLITVVDRHRAPHRRLLAVFDYLAEWLPANDFRGCAFLNTVPEFSDHESAPRRVVRQHKQALRDYLAELCVEAGHPGAHDTILVLVEGGMAQAAVVAETWPVTTARKAAQQLLNHS